MQSTANTEAQTTPTLLPYLGLFFGVAGGASAAILIRLAQSEDVPSLLIAAGRMLLSSLLMMPIALRHADTIRRLTRRQLLLMGLAGFWLAVHFSAYILSLEYTSVLIAQVLVLTNPLWVAGLEVLFLGLRANSLITFGILFAITGGMVIAIGGGSDAGLGDNPALGATLAILGAIASSIYMVIGRQIRAHLPLIPYVSLVYGCGGLFGVLFLVLSGTQVTGYSAEGYFWILMVTMIPQMVGHNGMNYALRFFPATYVSIVSQLIAVFAAVLAFLIFDEVPAWLQILGSAILLGGVILASLGQSRRSTPSR